MTKKEIKAEFIRLGKVEGLLEQALNKVRLVSDALGLAIESEIAATKPPLVVTKKKK